MNISEFKEQLNYSSFYDYHHGIFERNNNEITKIKTELNTIYPDIEVCFSTVSAFQNIVNITMQSHELVMDNIGDMHQIIVDCAKLSGDNPELWLDTFIQIYEYGHIYNNRDKYYPVCTSSDQIYFMDLRDKLSCQPEGFNVNTIMDHVRYFIECKTEITIDSIDKSRLSWTPIRDFIYAYSKRVNSLKSGRK